MSEYVLRSEVRGNHKVDILTDSCADSPMCNQEMYAKHIFEYSDGTHSLHADCDWESIYGKYGSRHNNLHDAVVDLALKLNPKLTIVDLALEINPDLPVLDCLDDKCINELDFDKCIEFINKHCTDVVVKRWSSTGYCQGDYIEGFSYCTKAQFAYRYGELPDNWKELADKFIDDEVKMIGIWIWGMTCGYVLYEKVQRHISYPNLPDRKDEDDEVWEEIDSCNGYYEEPDDLLEIAFGEL